MTDYEMFDVSDIDGVTVIRLSARELDETKLQRLTRELGRLVEDADKRRLVIDLGTVAFLTSTGIGAMIALQKKLHTDGGKLKLCGLNPDIHSLFTITQVDRLFDIHATAEDAAKSFAG